MTTVANNAPYRLGEFWKKAPLDGRGRGAQCSFFAALMERYPGRLYQIGQKTGAMDFPALLGIPTVYIEDSQIPTTATGRMRRWTDPETLQLYRRLEVEDPPSLPGKGARRFTENYNDEEAASNDRRRIGEAKWRMAGLLFELCGKWNDITQGSAKEPECISDIFDAVNRATPQELQTWKTNINALSDDECKNENCIRGYTAEDLTKVEAALTDLRANYSGPASIGKIIIRKPGGKYEYRTE